MNRNFLVASICQAKSEAALRSYLHTLQNSQLSSLFVYTGIKQAGLLEWGVNQGSEIPLQSALSGFVNQSHGSGNSKKARQLVIDYISENQTHFQRLTGNSAPDSTVTPNTAEVPSMPAPSGDLFLFPRLLALLFTHTILFRTSEEQSRLLPLFIRFYSPEEPPWASQHLAVCTSEATEDYFPRSPVVGTRRTIPTAKSHR